MSYRSLYSFIKIFKFLGLMMAFCVPVFGQSPVMDSLKEQLEKTQDPVKRVDLLNKLALEFYDYNDSIGLNYAQQAVELANKAKYKRGLKSALTLAGFGYMTLAEYDKAFKHMWLSNKIESPDSINLTAYNFSSIANLHRLLANYDSARYYYMRALSLKDDGISSGMLGMVYKNLGHLEVILWNNDQALHWLKESERLAISNRNNYLLAEVYGHLGTIYDHLLEYDLAEFYYDKLCEIASQQILYFHLIKCELRKAELLSRKGLYTEALSSGLNALKLTESYEYAPQVLEVYTMIGNIYSDLGQYELALRYYFLALEISERYKIRWNTAQLYAQIGWVNKQQSNFDLALQYVNRSLELRQEIGDKHGVSNAFNYRGLIFYQTKKYNEAANDFKLSRKLREEIGHIEGIAAAVFNLSLVYEDLHEYEKALAMLDEVMVMERKVVNPVSLGVTYNQVANILIKLNRLNEARKYLDLAAIRADQSNSILVKLSNEQYLAKWCEAMGDYKNAFHHQVRYQQLNDSVYNRSVATKLVEMEALYRIEQKEQQIKILNQENELKENRLTLQQSRIKLQRIIIVLSLIGFVLVAVLAFNIYLYNRKIRRANYEILEQKEEIQSQAEELSDANEILVKLNREITEKTEEIQAQSEELMEANQTIFEINKGLEEKINERTNRLKEAYKELDTFFYRASHDFRRPLTTFMGLAEVARITVKDKTALELFEKVDETAHTLDRMLVKLQSISDVGTQQLVYKEVFITELINDILDSFRDEIQHKNMKVSTQINLSDSFYSYPAMVKIVLGNLIENAIQFHSPDNPVMSITVHQEENRVVLKVADNGQGIEAEMKDKIFEMYFRGSDRSKGNGLGLYIAKKAVEKLGGTITVESAVYMGTTFTVTLPMGNSNQM